MKHVEIGERTEIDVVDRQRPQSDPDNPARTPIRMASFCTEVYDDDTYDSSSVIAMSSTRSPEQHMTEDIVRAFVVDIFDDFGTSIGKEDFCMVAFWEKAYADNYVLVRPSGNPISGSSFLSMLLSGDMVIKRNKLISVDSIRLISNGLVAIVTYTAEQYFVYKGTAHADWSVYSCVIEERDGEPKIVHEHRTTGQPVPVESRWATSSSIPQTPSPEQLRTSKTSLSVNKQDVTISPEADAPRVAPRSKSTPRTTKPTKKPKKNGEKPKSSKKVRRRRQQQQQQPQEEEQEQPREKE